MKCIYPYSSRESPCQSGNYPSSDGTVPTAVASGTADKTAVFNQPFRQGPADITQAGGLSAYGIMGLSGNVRELEETTKSLSSSSVSVSGSRGVRGGNWIFSSGFLSASNRGSFDPSFEDSDVGFRVASLNSVPEPTSFAMFGIAMLGMSRRRRRLS